MYKIFNSWMFYFMTAHIVSLFILLCMNLKLLFTQIKTIKKRTWLILIIIFVYGFCLRNAEYWRGPFSDGYMLEDSAQAWIYTGHPNITCMAGKQSDCILYSNAPSPTGFPYLIALAHLIFGINTLHPSIISAVLSSLTIIIVFLISYLLFHKESAGLFATVVFTLIPLNIIQSQTGLPRPTGLFFSGLTILFYLLALRNNRIISWMLSILCLSYAIYVRQESYMLFPFLLLFIFVFKYNELRQIIKDFVASKNKELFSNYRKDLLLLFYLFVLFQIPALHWLIFRNPFAAFSKGGLYGCDGIWGLTFNGLLIQGSALLLQLFNNSPLYPNIGIFHYNLLSSIFFAFAIIWIFASRNKNGFFITSIFVAYFLVYSLMFDGNTWGTGILMCDYMRRSVMLHIPYAVISGYGVFLVYQLLEKRIWMRRILWGGFVLYVSLNLIIGKVQNKKTVKLNGKGSLSDISFYFPKKIFHDARRLKKYEPSLMSNYDYRNYWIAMDKIPDNCLILASNNLLVLDSVFKNKNFQSIQLGRIQPDTIDMLRPTIKKNNCIIYIEDYYCMNKTYVQWQPYDFPCSYIKNNFASKLLFKEGSINIYELTGYKDGDP